MDIIVVLFLIVFSINEATSPIMQSIIGSLLVFGWVGSYLGKAGKVTIYLPHPHPPSKSPEWLICVIRSIWIGSVSNVIRPLSTPVRMKFPELFTVSQMNNRDGQLIIF